VTDESRETGDIETTETAEAVADDPDEAENEVGESVTEARADDDSPGRPKREQRNWSRGLRKVKVLPVALVLLLLLTSAGVATWVYFERYQPNRQTDPGVAEAAVSAESQGTVALLSYSPESLDKDFANAKSYLSGDFLSYYNQFTEQIVAPAAKQKSLKTTAHVIRAGVSELHPDSAVILVYVDQSTTSKDKPDPAMSASSVRVSMIRSNGTWLITKFDPV
jgi:Mce-associated membrane protein